MPVSYPFVEGSTQQKITLIKIHFKYTNKNFKKFTNVQFFINYKSLITIFLVGRLLLNIILDIIKQGVFVRAPTAAIFSQMSD